MITLDHLFSDLIVINYKAAYIKVPNDIATGNIFAGYSFKHALPDIYGQLVICYVETFYLWFFCPKNNNFAVSSVPQLRYFEK